LNDSPCPDYLYVLDGNLRSKFDVFSVSLQKLLRPHAGTNTLALSRQRGHVQIHFLALPLETKGLTQV
jgi:hypothetical protein